MLDASHARPASAPVDRAQSFFESVNAGLVLKTRSLLNRIAGSAALQPRLLNTLSLLEHMGSHRIMATQNGAAIELATLRHLADECQHASFMKRKAEKAAGHALEYRDQDLLAASAARGYFRRLEASLRRRLGRQAGGKSCYLLMSLIVEFRAVWFYSLYQQSLDRQGHSLSLKRLLGEEQNHLTEMAERLAQAGAPGNATMESLIGIEHGLYGRLLESLHQSAS
jgi:hypothetical protein